MTVPSARQLLDVWDAGRGLDHTDRALLLLECAGAPDGADLPVGRRDGLLLDLRERLFGARIDALAPCPSCAARLDVAFDVDAIRVAGGARPDQLELRAGGFDLTARLLTTRDLLATRASGDAAAVRAGLLERSLIGVTVDGRPVPAGDLPAAVLDRVAVALGEADPQAEVELDLRCPECGDRWRRHFDIVEFLWAELGQLVQQMLRDVHVLARAYGWDEDAVLRLPPWRRRYYLEMVANG